MPSPVAPVQVRIGGPPKVEYKRAEIKKANRMVMSVDGPAKSGKTHFCLTAPGPVSIHNLDHGLEGVVDEFLRSEKVIYAFDYHVPLSAKLPGSGLTSLLDASARIWEQYVVQFRDTLAQSKSVITDTGGEAWNLCRMARLGKLTQVLPVQYTAVNAEFRQLTQLALTNLETNVIYTHRMKPVYKNDQRTDELERAGFGEIEYDVQTVVRTYRDLTKTGVDQFVLRIEECRANIEATGKEFRGHDCTFQKVAVAVYPNTTEADWS